jgi:hypothetical protein
LGFSRERESQQSNNLPIKEGRREDELYP